MSRDWCSFPWLDTAAWCRRRKGIFVDLPKTLLEVLGSKEKEGEYQLELIASDPNPSPSISKQRACTSRSLNNSKPSLNINPRIRRMQTSTFQSDGKRKMISLDNCKDMVILLKQST
jgi:hypothetical protein